MKPTQRPVIQKAYVSTAHGQLHVRHVPGRVEHTEAVVFFHRTPVTSRSFERVMHRLAGWRPMFAFDTPGFGESFTPDSNAPLETFVESFAEALQHLGVKRCHLVGHHTGAHFAAELALSVPGLAASLLVDGAMVASDEERQRLTPPAPAPQIDRDGHYARQTWDFLQPYYTVFDPACVHDEFVGALSSTFTRGACMKAVRAHDLGATLAAVCCPIVASAARDDVFVGHIERIAALCPSAVLQVYGDAGIASPELQSEEFAGLVKQAAALASSG